ncbi:MAG: TonB-dependent receptor [Bacteroidia bacterium]|nr:TonB-dependent receptor [Bacteroidia bacterium]
MKNLLLFYLFLFTGSLVFSQTEGDLRINVRYAGTSFPEVVRDLEARYPVNFFYAEEWTDSLAVNFSEENISLNQFLGQIFAGTRLSFFIYAGGKIILTRDYRIQNTLPEDFFSEGKPRKNLEEPAQTLFSPEEKDDVGPALSNIENTLFKIGNNSPGAIATIAGYVRDIKSGEPLEGVTIFKENPVQGTLTDAFGYYVLTLTKGQYDLFFRYVGRKDTKRKIDLTGDGRLNVEMEEEIIALKEVLIVNERSSVEQVSTGIAKLSLQEIKTIPTVLGEADVMKITLSLPGVLSVGEGASGFNVRGGNTDQNLITIGDGVVYNPNHLFGFFSAFNPEVIKSANLYKSGIQAQYGGRVSSVFDIDIRDGNKKEFSMAGGISPVTGKITLEGPIKKDQSSWILGVRSTYSQWLLGLLENTGLNNSQAFFGDVIGKIHYQINDKNTFSISGYTSRDNFRLNADTLFQYANNNVSVRLRHMFNNRFSGLFSGSFTNYSYNVESDQKPLNAFTLGYSINQFTLKSDFDFFPHPDHKIKFGGTVNTFSLQPGSITPLGDSSVIKAVALQPENGVEPALYVGDEYEISTRFSAYGGLRLSGFALLGPGNVYTYAENLPRETDFITDTLSYSSGKIIKTYGGPELRLSGRYKLAQETSVKFSYDKTRQYIHMLTNTVAVSPTDTWRLSNTYLKPQTGDQFAVGLYKNIPQKGLEFSIETYYKFLKNLPEYKSGADLLVNEAIETDVISAKGRSYGVELFARKKSGKLTGWVSYTWSRAFVKADSPYDSERINGGKWYPSNFDRPHNLAIVTNYKANRRLNLSVNFTYTSGRPTTIPITQYQLTGAPLPFFSERNKYRVPDYIRIDAGLNLEGTHKVHKLIHSSWSFSIYNLTGRNNAYSVFSTVTNGNIATYKLSVFSQAIPTITYNFRFI